MKMIARYNGQCSKCNGRIVAGKHNITRQNGAGWAHSKCDSDKSSAAPLYFYGEKVEALVLDGPYPNANKWSDWDEFPEWVAVYANNEGDDLEVQARYLNFEAAVTACERIADRIGVEFVNEAQPANRW